MHLLSQETEPDWDRLMSRRERAFLAAFAAARRQHLTASVLSRLPEMHQVALEEVPHIADGPRLNVHVFARVLEDIGAVQLGESRSQALLHFVQNLSTIASICPAPPTL